MLHEWRQIILEEQQCAWQIATKGQKELTAQSKEENDHKASAKEDIEHKDNHKVEKEHEDSTKEELHQNASFFDMETDDEASWVEDGVDSHGCSLVEGDDFKDKVNDLIIAFFPAYRDVLQSAKHQRLLDYNSMICLKVFCWSLQLYP